MSSAICFNLDQSKILLSGNGLMVSNKRGMNPAAMSTINIPQKKIGSDGNRTSDLQFSSLACYRLSYTGSATIP